MVVNRSDWCIVPRDMEKTMSMAIALEDLALGEVTLDEGAKVVGSCLSKLDLEIAHGLYQALRSWTWKALEARRRDDELSGWMDLLSRASTRIESHSRDLAVKLEGFMELLHASIMTAGAGAQRNPLEKKHAKQVLRIIYRGGGRVRRKRLMTTLALKAPNLSRVMTPLLDDGFVMREVEGREVFYRLTMKGSEAALPLVAHEVIARPSNENVSVRKIDPSCFNNRIVKAWEKPISNEVLVFARHYGGRVIADRMEHADSCPYRTRYDAMSPSVEPSIHRGAFERIGG